ncbi:MAG: spinster family MFS transporter [Acidobacteriota bacterium]
MIKNRTAILVLLTGLNLLNYIDRMIVAAVLERMQAPAADGGLALSNTEGGLLVTAFLLGYFITSPLFGARADKGPRTGLIALGVAIWSIATFATGLAHGFVELLCARIVVGVGEASYATLAPTIIDDITPPESKNRALAIFYLAIPVGSALGYVVGGFIQARWGWRYAFFLCGGPGLALALLCLAIAEPSRKLREAHGKVIDGLRTIAKLPQFRRAVLGYCAYTGAIGAFSTWAPKFISEQFYQHAYTAKEALKHANFNFGIVTVVAGALGTLVGGRWADRAQRGLPAVTAATPHDARENRLGVNVLLRVSAIGMVIAVPTTVACFLMPSATLFFAFAFVAELGLFLSTSPVNAVGLRAVPPELRASAMAGMIFAIHLFGDLWSPTVLGILNDLLVSTVAMMAVPLVFALSAYWWWPREREAT